MKKFKIDFNIQRFAGDMQTTANIASPYSGVDSSSPISGLSPEMKMFYSTMLIKSVGPELVHAQFLDDQPLPKNNGKMVEWRKRSKFQKATTPLTEGVTPDKHTITVTSIIRSTNQYGDWSQPTDILSMTALDNCIVEETEAHSENAKLTMDTVTRNAMIADITAELLAGDVDVMAKLNGKLTPLVAARIQAELKKKNAPKIDGSYVMIVHPSCTYDLITDDLWIDVNKYSNATAIFKGEIGKIFGIRFVESTEAKVNKAKVLGNGTAGKCTSAKVVSYSTASSTYTLTFADNTFVADELNNKKVYIHDISADGIVIEEVTVSDTTTSTLVLSAAPSITPAEGDIVFLSDVENALDGEDYFTCICLGAKVGKKVALDDKNVEMIVKPLGYGDDPLNQRASVGWKVNGYAAAITQPDYTLKFYCKASIAADSND